MMRHLELSQYIRLMLKYLALISVEPILSAHISVEFPFHNVLLSIKEEAENHLFLLQCMTIDLLTLTLLFLLRIEVQNRTLSCR